MPFDGQIQHDLTTRCGRLLHLADYVERLPRINMVIFVGRCGTPYCALGHASFLPEFRALGLEPFPARLGPGMVHKWAERSYAFFLGPVNHYDYGDLIHYCFGHGTQFDYLNKRYTPADVARHLRMAADIVKG